MSDIAQAAEDGVCFICEDDLDPEDAGSWVFVAGGAVVCSECAEEYEMDDD